MAKIVITFEDIVELVESGLPQVSVKAAINVDRGGDPEELNKFPATPAMLFGLTAKRLYEVGIIERMIGFVCRDIMTNAGLSFEQQAAAEEAGRKACE